MADSFIAIDEPAVTDKRLDTESLTVGANTVERERVRIAGLGATDLAPVDATNGLDVDVTRVQGTVSVTGPLTDAQLRATAVPVSAASLPLPTGAATETTLAGLKAAFSVTAIQATTLGDTVLLAAGTRKLKRVEVSNSHATTAVVVGLKVASLNAGAVFGKRYLPAAGGQAVWVFPNGFLQVTAEAVNVNLSAAGQVEVTVYYE